jgi:hypothetical protein
VHPATGDQPELRLTIADGRFVKVVDTCEDGDRAAALETGIGERED